MKMPFLPERKSVWTETEGSFGPRFHAFESQLSNVLVHVLREADVKMGFKTQCINWRKHL